jgi:hypothetical protein
VILEAYILINTEPAKIWDVAEATQKIEGARMGHAVSGRFDAVAYVEFQKIEDLGRIVQEIQQIKGVRQTQTLLTIPRPLRK